MNQVVRLTSTAPAAIAVLQLSGPKAESWLTTHWIPNAATKSSLAINHIRYGVIRCESTNIGDSPNNGGPLDVAGESIVVCKTATDTFELHCHGGPTASQRILEQLLRDGFELVSWSDVLSSTSSDTIANEATEDILRATSIRTAAILMDQRRGALRRELESVIAYLREEQLEIGIRILRELLERSEVGQHLISPWNVALAGPPNVGKSSLLNAILGYQRAIVHESAGTTRDLLREQTSIDGWPIQITDSAGVRATDNDIELQGIHSSFAAVEEADCVLILVSPEQGWTVAHHQILTKLTTQNVILIATKSDVADFHAYPEDLNFARVSTSLNDPSSIARLLSCISQVLVPLAPSAGQGVPFRREHSSRINECLSLLDKREILRCIDSLQSWICLHVGR